jgi:hypothetical protein
MADKRKAVSGCSLTHTLHVWPTREVMVQSAYWPAWWYPAYERAVRELADWVARRILGGLPDCPEPIRMELRPAGSLTFSFRLWGTTIEVLIREFEGPEDPEPDAPGPDGGVRQRAADGLVLALRGTGKEFTVVRFYDGLVPSVPVGRGGRLRPCTVGILTAPSGAARPGMAGTPGMRAGGGGHAAATKARPGSGNGWQPGAAPAAKKQAGSGQRPRIKVETHHHCWMDALHKARPVLVPFACLSSEFLDCRRPAAFRAACAEAACALAMADPYSTRRTCPDAANLRIN